MTTNAPTIRAIPTTYNGVTFRSRTEARWAVFLDAMGIAWQYEAEGYQLDGGWYLPDFWLPGLNLGNELGSFLEVKPDATQGERKAEQLAVLTQCAVAITNGTRHEMAEIRIVLPQGDSDVFWDNHGFIRCSSCGRATLSYSGSCARQEYSECSATWNHEVRNGDRWPSRMVTPEQAHHKAITYRFWNPQEQGGC